MTAFIIIIEKKVAFSVAGNAPLQGAEGAGGAPRVRNYPTMPPERHCGMNAYTDLTCLCRSDCDYREEAL